MTEAIEVKCRRNCTGRVDRVLDPPAFLTCSRLSGSVEMVLPIEEACGGCGVVWLPADLAAQGFTAEVDELGAALRVQAARHVDTSVGVIGKTGDYKSLRLPSWYDVPAPIPRLAANVRNWSLQSTVDIEMRRGAMQHALGLTKDNPSGSITVLGLTIEFGEFLVTKLINKRDSGHNQLAHLGIGTLRAAREAWQDHDKIRFLGLYRIGEDLATQIVVIDAAGGFVSTIYEIDDPAPEVGHTRDPIEARTNRKRSGTCRYLAY